MRHLYSGRKLKRTSSHRKALLMNLATSLLEHKRLQTTEAKAKELRPFVEQLITRAKNAYVRERSGQLPTGQVDVHARRVVGRIIRRKAVLQALFDEIAPVVENRPGGYTRIVKMGQRRGDGSRTAVIELVDFYAEQDGATSLSRTRRQRPQRAAAQPAQKTAQPTVQDALEQSVAAAMTTIEEAASHNEEVAEAPAETAPETTEAPAAEAQEGGEPAEGNEEETKG